MAPSGPATRDRTGRRWTGAGRMVAIAMLIALVAACCPAPLVPTGSTPTAFVAVVADSGPTSWVAAGPGGARYVVAGEAPGAVGASVYVSGALAADGSLVVERADPVANR